MRQVGVKGVGLLGNRPCLRPKPIMAALTRSKRHDSGFIPNIFILFFHNIRLNIGYNLIKHNKGFLAANHVNSWERILCSRW